MDTLSQVPEAGSLDILKVALPLAPDTPLSDAHKKAQERLATVYNDFFKEQIATSNYPNASECFQCTPLQKIAAYSGFYEWLKAWARYLFGWLFGQSCSTKAPLLFYWKKHNVILIKIDGSQTGKARHSLRDLSSFAFHIAPTLSKEKSREDWSKEKNRSLVGTYIPIEGGKSLSLVQIADPREPSGWGPIRQAFISFTVLPSIPNTEGSPLPNTTITWTI